MVFPPSVLSLTIIPGIFYPTDKTSTCLREKKRTKSTRMGGVISTETASSAAISAATDPASFAGHVLSVVGNTVVDATTGIVYDQNSKEYSILISLAKTAGQSAVGSVYPVQLNVGYPLVANASARLVTFLEGVGRTTLSGWMTPDVALSEDSQRTDPLVFARVFQPGEVGMFVIPTGQNLRQFDVQVRVGTSAWLPTGNATSFTPGLFVQQDVATLLQTIRSFSGKLMLTALSDVVPSDSQGAIQDLNEDIVSCQDNDTLDVFIFDLRQGFTRNVTVVITFLSPSHLAFVETKVASVENKKLVAKLLDQLKRAC